MTPDRRNDLAGKLGGTILTLLIAALITIMIVGANKKSESNTAKLSDHGERITSNTEGIKYIGKDFSEYKVEQRTFNSKLDTKMDRLLEK